MDRFTKKPVTISAVRWTGENVDDIRRLALGTDVNWVVSTTRLVIHTPEGLMEATPGDWVIRGVKGELYPCKPDIFEMTYTPATPAPVGTFGFGRALELLQEGHRVARQGWNGKRMYVFFKMGSIAVGTYLPETIDGVPTSLFTQGVEGTVTRLPCLCLRTVSGAVLDGWLASQTDILATDWTLVEGEA